MTASVDPEVAAALAEREQEASAALRVSRAAARPVLRAAEHVIKSEAMPVTRQSVAHGSTRTVEASDPRDIARGMLSDFGWSSDQFSCLDELYFHESGWDHTATNPTSGAYGIPQALPAEKLAASGADWRTNPETQLDWGLKYIDERYGSPCGAWGFWQANNYY